MRSQYFFYPNKSGIKSVALTSARKHSLDSRGMSARDVISNLRELAALTVTADGAQRLAWGPVWREARQWFNGKLATLGITPEIAAAGALTVTEVEHLIDRTGTRLVDALREHGVELARRHES